MKGHYHHGDLRNALLAEARSVLEETGVQGLSFRDLARRLGVSHAAPAHHFPDKRALLQQLAASGFVTLADALAGANATTASAQHRKVDVGVAYVAFALANPQRYRLMFTSNLLGEDAPPELVEASGQAYAQLLVSVGKQPDAEGPDQAPELAAWSIVHGLVMLWIDGQLGAAPAPQHIRSVVVPILAQLG